MKKLLGLIIIGILFWGGYKLFSPGPESPYKLFAQYIPGTYRIGFTNLDKEISIDRLYIAGTIPPWLSGTLFRTGPAKFTTDKSWVSNWFDGLAMIHAFSFSNGQVSYANKFLKSSDYEHVQKTGKMNYAGFAQDPCRSIFKNLFSYFFPQGQAMPSIPNANVNIAKFSQHLVALTEIPLPVEFDAKTLYTLGVMHHNDGFPESRIQTTAHPHYDPVRKEHIAYFIRFGRHSSYNIVAIKDGSTKRELITSVPVDKPSYMHSFGLTDKYAILTGLPLVVNPLDLLIMRKAFIKNFKWKPELGTQFIVVDRINNKLVEIYKAEPFFAFHVVNAFEINNTIVIDIVVYPNAAGIGEANLTKILERTPEVNKVYGAIAHEPDSDVTEAGILKRFTIDMAHTTITSKIISAEHIELPRINYDKYNGKEYNYVYAYAQSKKALDRAYVADKLVKINVKTGDVINWQEDKCYPGEPVFVAKPDAQSEDDGVILSIVLDAQKAVSFLLLLNAQDFREIARAYVPHHIPFGIHGQFY